MGVDGKERWFFRWIRERIGQQERPRVRCYAKVNEWLRLYTSILVRNWVRRDEAKVEAKVEAKDEVGFVDKCIRDRGSLLA